MNVLYPKSSKSFHILKPLVTWGSFTFKKALLWFMNREVSPTGNADPVTRYHLHFYLTHAHFLRVSPEKTKIYKNHEIAPTPYNQLAICVPCI